MEAKPALPSHKPILIWLIASQILALLSLVFWLLVAGLSVMAFDSGVTPEAWAFVIAVWSYPIWPLAFAIAAWIAYARKKDRLAGILTAFTFIPVLALILVLVFTSFFYSMGI
jgi:K+-sensing histidine kinase KdpD